MNNTPSSETEPVRVIVAIALRPPDAPAAVRQTPEERKAAIDTVLREIEAVLPEIDAVLQAHGGWRMPPNALGCLIVETPPSGVDALRALPCVASVVEDQPMQLIL